MNQVELFKKLLLENNIWDAHLVGKNIYNKNLSSKEAFKDYFSFLISLGNYPIEIQERKFFANEAETAFLFYCANAEINEEQLMFIKDCRSSLMDLNNSIADIEYKVLSKEKEDKEAENNLNISALVTLKGKLHKALDQKQFDSILVEVNEKENAILKEYLTKEQKTLYDSLTREYSELISLKMTELNQKELTEYNKQAARDFKYVFEEFKNNEDQYKNSHSQLFTLVSKRMFSYDASKLFNETLIYYNHVYSYIFSKLDDNGKFRLTQISIDSEKINR